MATEILPQHLLKNLGADNARIAELEEKFQKSGRVEVYDKSRKGLSLNLSSNGKEVWFVWYKSPQSGKRTRYKLGEAKNLTLDDARFEAEALQRKIRKTGKDPQLEGKLAKKKIDPKATKFADAAEQFHNSYLKTKWKRHEKAYQQFVLHAKGWGEMPASAITDDAVTAVLDRLMRQGKHTTANRWLEVTRLFFKWAATRSIVDKKTASLVRIIEKPSKENPRDRNLTDEEIRQLWPEFEAIGHPFGHLLQMLLLTGQRLNEVAGMKWSDIQWQKFETRKFGRASKTVLVEAEQEERGAFLVWTLDKVSTKSQRASMIPLPSAARALLSDVERHKLVDYVFHSGVGKRPVQGVYKRKYAIDEKLNLPQWTIHDLRRTCRTNLGNLGVQSHIAELVLNHAVKGLEGTYDRGEYLPEKAEALEMWSDYLTGLTAGANVVPMRRA